MVTVGSDGAGACLNDCFVTLTQMDNATILQITHTITITPISPSLDCSGCLLLKCSVALRDIRRRMCYRRNQRCLVHLLHPFEDS